MKKLISLTILAGLTFFTLAQAPQGFSYQAVIRDSEGQPLAEQQVSIRLTLQDEAGETSHYAETHTVTTSPQGVVSLVVGSGTPIEKAFVDIPWNEDNVYIKVEVDPTGGSSYSELGTTKLQAVPYALHAMTAEETDPLFAENFDFTDAVEGDMLQHDGEKWVSVTPDFLTTLWQDGDNQVTTVVNVGIGTNSPTEMLDVDGNIRARGRFIGEGMEVEPPESIPEEPIFVVRNSLGQIVLAVYEKGVRMYVEDDVVTGEKGNKSGFAIGGLTGFKQNDTEYFRVTPDSVRIYLREPAEKGNKGGFAIGGLTGFKADTVALMFVAPDSTRFYIDSESTGKGNKSGFAIGGLTGFKSGIPVNYFNVSADTTATIDPSEARILWYPTKEAFLAGRILIESPDSVGTNSWASGFESKSIGEFSQALGYRARAFGSNSTAIGNQSQAVGQGSFAFGGDAKALGQNSYAFGDNAFAQGESSYAFGSVGRDTFGVSTNKPSLAYGDYSFSFGNGDEALGEGSFALGTNCISLGKYSISAGYACQVDSAYGIAMGFYSHVGYRSGLAIGNKTFAMGFNSISLGYNNMAENSGSIAIGVINSSTGGASMAFGLLNQSSGNNSLAIGRENFASEYNAIAIGAKCEATGISALALGQNNKASGTYSISFGIRSEAVGYTSTAIGYECNANASHSFAFGANNNANGEYALAFGRSTVASGFISTSFGFNTVASGDYSVAFGHINTSSGWYSYTMGRQNQATNYGSVAIGRECISQGEYAFSLGYQSNARSFYSFALGEADTAYATNSYAIGAFVKAKGAYTMAFGRYTTAQSINSFVLGRYNVTSDSYSGGMWKPEDPLFVIGNGLSITETNNAMTVLKNGYVGIGTPMPNMHLTFSHKEPQYLGVERSPTSAGANFTILAGSGALHEYNNNGGDLLLSSGGSTGNGSSNIYLLTTNAEGSGNMSHNPTIKVTILGNGNMGIGTETPDKLLHVAGDAKIDGDIFYGSGTIPKPDFVFQPDYNNYLDPLDVDEFIKANGHMPWFTKAEYEVDGVNLTRMQFETVETVENLQLQIIEMKKEYESKIQLLEQKLGEYESLKSEIEAIKVMLTK